MKTYSISEGRKILGDLVDQVKYKRLIIAIGKRGVPDAFIVPNFSVDDDTEIPISQINSSSNSFKFLEEEPDIYSLDDLKKRYV